MMKRSCCLLLCCFSWVSPLSFDPVNDYLDVYPDPTDTQILQGRTPLYFALIQSLGGPLSLYDGSGSLAGVKVALDRINNDTTFLPGYTLHYTFEDSKVSWWQWLHNLLAIELLELASSSPMLSHMDNDLSLCRENKPVAIQVYVIITSNLICTHQPCSQQLKP